MSLHIIIKKELVDIKQNQVLILQHLDRLLQCHTPVASEPPNTPTVEESPPDVNLNIHVSDSGLPLPIQDGPHPLRIEGINLANVLPSSAIEKHKLLTIEETLSVPNFHTFTMENVGKISAILAREAIFGVKVMAKCTPLCAGKLPGLPINELYWLKHTMLQRFPHYWHNVSDFETVWKRCQRALEHCCSSLRRQGTITK